MNEWGVVVGGLIVLLIAAFGTYCSIRSANGTKERASRVKYAIRTWIFLAAVLGLFFGLQYVFPGLWSFLSEWGAVVGVLVGVLCPNFGSYLSSRNTVGPKERAFLFKVNVLAVPIFTVALLGLAIGLGYVMPPPHKRLPLLLSVFLILAPALVISTWMCNRRLPKIRAEDSREKSP